MKKVVTLLNTKRYPKLLLIGFVMTISSYVSSSVLGQPGRRDTVANGALTPYQNSILDADVLTGASTMHTVVPRERLCFDKIIKVKQITARGPSEGCLFINTTTGLIAHSPIKPGAIGTCDIKPDREDFSLFVMGLAGNTYHYFNIKKKNEIEHHMATMNSQQYVYQFAGGGNSATLHKKTEWRSYYDNKIKAYAYRVDGRPETWFLLGKFFPDQVVMTPKKFLGNYGVGYQYSDKGLFIVMQLVAPALDSKILELRDLQTCFDPSGFKVFEEEFVTKATSSIQQKREKLSRQLAAINISNPCGQIKRSSIQFEQQALDRQEENVRKSTQGHIGQSTPAQQARADAMINYDDQIQLMIYDTEYKTCQTENEIARSNASQNPSPSRQQRLQQKLRCLNETIVIQRQTQADLKQVEREHVNQPGRIMAQKARVFMQAMKGCD